eukprot:2707586-Ditylum_brightwellii.AAC.1
MTLIAKEIKACSKEEKYAGVDNPQVNSVLIEKAGNTKIPRFSVPEDWVPLTPKTTEKEFAELGNLGSCPQYCYCHAFKNGAYIGHALPTGATPILLLPNSKHVIDDMEFFYNGWKYTTDTCARNGTIRTNFFPVSRMSSLYHNVLQKFGLGSDTMKEKEALLFHQLIIPIFNTKIRTKLVLRGAYSKKFDLVKIEELMKWDSILIHGGGRGGSDGAIFKYWQEGSDYNLYTEHFVY